MLLMTCFQQCLNMKKKKRLDCIRQLINLAVALLPKDLLRLHGLQLARLPCPSPSPGACSNSCPSSQ